MRFVTGLVVCLLSPSVLYGGAITITGSGTWDNTIVSDSGVSAPGASWSFSFVVSSPLDPSLVAATTNSTYSLNGAPVSGTFSFVEFYNASNYGGFDLLFDNGNGIEVYAPQLFDANYNLIPGSYAVTLDDVFASTYVGQPPGEGSGTVSIAAASVPEPSPIVCAGISLAAATGLALARRKRNAA